MKFRGGEFSTGTKGNFQSELTLSSGGIDSSTCLAYWAADPIQPNFSVVPLPTSSVTVKW